MKKERAEEILQSKGAIEVTYKNSPVWLEGISNHQDNKIRVKDLNTNEHLNVNIVDLKE